MRRLDDGDQFLRRALVGRIGRVGIGGFQVVLFLLDGFDLLVPTALADATGVIWIKRQPREEVVELFQGERFLLGDFDIRQVVIPDAPGRAASGEVKQIGLSACPRVDKDAWRQADNAPQITFIEQLSLGL